MHILCCRSLFILEKGGSTRKTQRGPAVLEGIQWMSQIISDNNGQMPIQALTHVHDSMERMNPC